MEADTSSDAALRANVEATLHAACELLGCLASEGARNRELAKAVYGPELEAHALATGTLHLALMRQNGVPGKTSPEIAHRLLLLASFVQGIDLCESAVSQGFYLQAAALLKQELETISAIEELKQGRRQDGRTPKVSYAPWSLGTLYGVLNDAAHVGKGVVLESVLAMAPQGEARPVAMTPQFNPSFAKHLFGVHTALLCWACWELDDLHTEIYGQGLADQEKQTLLAAVRILQKAGVLGDAADEHQGADHQNGAGGA
jgi:hypothetical protein